MNKVVKQLGGKIGMRGSLRAVSSDKNGHAKAIREESAEVSASADYDNGYTQETVIARAKMKPNSELAVATRFLNEYNHLNSTSYKVSSAQRNQNNIADIIAIDETAKKELKLQVTVSDTKPWLILAKGLFRRRGNAYKMHSAAIKAAIDKKLKKYRGSSKGVILLLDGWFGVTREILDNVRQHDQVFLQEVGFDEIWLSAPEVTQYPS